LNTQKRKTILIIQNIYDVLFHIEIMPDSYIGGRSLTSLSLFISGFQTALIIGEGKFDTKKFFEDTYYDFVSDKLKDISVGKHWLNRILKECDNDEEKAFDLFFALLEEFKLEKEAVD
jgi:hypothetical protein